MKYSELVDSGATPTEAQSFIKDSENVSVTLRMPRSLRDSAKEAASLSGMSLELPTLRCASSTACRGSIAND